MDSAVLGHPRSIFKNLEKLHIWGQINFIAILVLPATSVCLGPLGTNFFRISIWPNCKFCPRKVYSKSIKNTTLFTKWLYILLLKDLFKHFLEVIDTSKSDREEITLKCPRGMSRFVNSLHLVFLFFFIMALLNFYTSKIFSTLFWLFWLLKNLKTRNLRNF